MKSLGDVIYYFQQISCLLVSVLFSAATYAGESELSGYPNVFLVYVTENLGSPASAFGHVFLNFSKNPVPGPSDLSLAFSAKVDQGLSSLSYLYRGVSGGFSGTFTVEPLYRRIHEYNRVEQRSLVFFKIQLSQEERARLLEALYQPGNAEFPYYFFTDNCARRIDESLRYATRTSGAGNSIYWLPREVIRFHAPRFREVYRAHPSGTRVNREFDQLNSEGKNRVVALRQDVHLRESDLSSAEREFLADLLEHGFRNQREMSQNYSVVEDFSFQSRPWIEAESALRPKEIRSERITLRRFQPAHSKNGSLRFEIRPASQDFLDSPDPWGRELEFSILKTEFTLNDEGPFWLESLSLVRLRSFGENGFLPNRAFGLSLELNRKNELLVLTPELSFGFGVPLIASRSFHSSILGGAGVVTAVRGLNGFVSAEWNTIARLSKSVSAVKTIEARRYFGEGVFLSRILLQTELGHFRVAIGPDYETTVRKGSLLVQISASL